MQHLVLRFRNAFCCASIILLSLIVGSTTSAQTTELSFEDRLASATGDEAIEIGQEVFELLVYEDPSRARDLMLLADERSEGRTNYDLHSSVLRGVAVTYAIQNELDSAEKYYFLALAQAEQGEGTEIPRLILNIGILEQQRERYADALKRFQEALDMTAVNPNGIVEALAHYHIGLQMDAMGLLPVAEDHLRSSIEVEQNLTFRTYSLFELARVLARQDKFDEVDGLIEKGRDEIYDVSPGQYSEAIELRNTSEIALARGQFAEALSLSVEARELFGQLNTHDREAEAACVAARSALELQQFEEAIGYGDACLTISESVQYERQRADGANVLSLAYERRGDLKAALSFSRTASESRYRFLQAQSRQQTEIAMASVQEVFNQRAVESAQKNEAEARALATRTRAFLAFVLVGTLIAVGLLVALFRVSRQRQKINDQLTGLVKEREVLMAELNHRVKNNLQVVASLLGLERRRIDPASDTAASMQAVQARVLSMASIHENLQNSDSMEVVPVKEYLEKLAERLTGIYQTECIVNVEEGSQQSINIDALGPIGLIICELVSNAFEHGYEGQEHEEIVFSFKADESGGYLLSVIDSGVGLPSDFDLEKTNSLGLDLVKDLAQQIDAHFGFLKRAQGTVWELRIPQTAFV
ncbi:histidine kinase dimerization/phosphoacceptor domain -containing protein [Tateyamaria sp. SN3-11]|uniref:histidine kinase dimerization/phosphoacceptor domain -containing protein n=1 Tax=Tateyamaria sp. SN3-11 TaxID=3092147 RepID=UPI0039EA797B